MCLPVWSLKGKGLVGETNQVWSFVASMTFKMVLPKEMDNVTFEPYQKTTRVTPNRQYILWSKELLREEGRSMNQPCHCICMNNWL
jgi:hypothetical protein